VSIVAIIRDDLGLTFGHLWSMLARRQGYATFDEVIEDLHERFSDEEAEYFRAKMTEALAARQGFRSSGDDLSEPALLALPEALFLDALEYGFKSHGGYGGGHPATNEINELLKRRGIYFRFDRWGHADWVGDPGAWEAVTEPALAALQDERLGGARNEFEAARVHLRGGSSKDLEDAIEEAGKAVESTMKVLLDAHGISLTGKETAYPLFTLLKDKGIVEAEAEPTVLGAARIRNQWGGHGSGATARTPPSSLADLAVQAAAASIVFLSSRLP
jgi:hypothetical protein